MALFDLIQSAMGRPDPSMAIARALGQAPGQPGSPQGPQPLAGAAPPGPPAGQGGAPGASGTPPGPQAAPQPQATQTPPDLGQMFLQLTQRQQAEEMFNRGLAGLTAAFSPMSQRASIAHEFDNMSGDPGSTMGNIMRLQQWNIQQQQLANFQQAAPDIAKSLQAQGVNITPQEVLAGGPEMIKTLTQYGMPTEAQRNADAAAKAYAAAHPEATPADIADYKANMLAQTVSNMDPMTRAWTNAVRVWRSDPDNKDKPLPPEMANPMAYAADQASTIATSKASAAEKLDARTSLASVAPTWEHAVSTIDWLTDPAHKDAVTTAIQHPEMTGANVAGRTIGGVYYGQDALTARGMLDTLANEQFRTGMTSVKNVRTQTEANKIGGSMASLDRPTNDQQAINDELARLKQVTYAGHANVLASAGQPVPAKYNGLVQPDYLDPKSPLYNGATQQAPPKAAAGGEGAALKPLTDAQRQQAQTLIARDGRDAVIGHLKAGGYDTSGL